MADSKGIFENNRPVKEKTTEEFNFIEMVQRQDKDKEIPHPQEAAEHFFAMTYGQLIPIATVIYQIMQDKDFQRKDPIDGVAMALYAWAALERKRKNESSS
jgi:hypothetical protein